MFSMCGRNKVEDEAIWEKTGVAAGSRVIRAPKGKAKGNKMQIQEKPGFIGFASHRTAPFSFTVESI